MKDKAFLIGLISVALVTGCATPKYGNLTTNAPYDVNLSIVDDAVQRLETLYPPASTQLNIGQPVAKTDTFGNNLVNSLRNKGYAVQEYSEKSRPSDGLTLRYILDASSATELYRLKLIVGGDVLTRAYTDYNNMLAPAGSWAKMGDR